MKDTSSKILSNHNISGKFWQMRFETGWQGYAPGQFVMLQVPGNKAFLRRPFGIARMKGDVVEICYKAIGAGTTEMSAIKAGEKVNVLGPLGNGFTLPKSGRASSATTQHLLVAGGYGVAPLLGLAERICSGTLHLSAGNLAEGSTGRVHLFYGAKTGSELLYLDEFKELGVELHIATEDGSAGEKGLVTDLLQDFLRLDSKLQPDPKIYRIFACGPKGMLRSVAEGFSLPSKGGTLKGSATSHDCQLSLESYMGCGYGVCMGCAVKLKSGEYARVCKDGPVFDAEQVVL